MLKLLHAIKQNATLVLATLLAFSIGLHATQAFKKEPKEFYTDGKTTYIKYDYPPTGNATCKPKVHEATLDDLYNPSSY